MPTVVVSARQLLWPSSCACCGSRNNLEHGGATYNRTTGKRVVRVSSWSWSYPICVPCVEHVAYFDAATAARTTGLILVVVASVFMLPALLCSAASFVAWRAPVAPVVVALMCWALVALLGGLALRSFVQAKGDAGRCRKHMGRHCACEGSPIKYVQMYGTAHTLEFESDEYAGEFCQANAAKVRQVYD